MTGNKGKRLSKIARELNVGISTIVEFLNKKGYDIDSNPNTKIAPECIDLLSKEYKTDLTVKKESEKLSSLRKNREKKESVSIEDTPEDNDISEDKQDNEKNEDVILIKDNTSSGNDSVKKTEKTKTPTEIANKSKGLKIVGKIELDKKPEKKEEPKQPKKEEPIQEKSETEKPIVKAKPEPEKKPQPKQEQKQEPADKQQEQKKHTEQPKAEETKVEQTKKPQSENPKQDDKKPSEHQEKTETKQPVVDNQKQDSNNQKQDKTQLKEKPRKKQETKSESKQKESDDKGRDKQQKQDSGKQKTDDAKTSDDTKEKVKDDNLFRTSVKQLSGPTVVGRIELPDKAKSRNSDNDRNRQRPKKKKRKRIQRDPVKLKNEQQKTTDANKKPKGKEQQPNANKNKDVKSQRNQPPRGKRKPLQRKEVNEEDVQKQIKETLARLTSKGKSKTSRHRRNKRDLKEQRVHEEVQQREDEKKILQVTEFVSVSELASMMEVEVNQIIATCMSLGLMVSINQRLDADTMSLVAEEFGYTVDFVSIDIQEGIDEEEDDDENRTFRPPIVTVMGHVDHGKTSLLDYVRSTNVIAGEAGGITQHIGAYRVTLDTGKEITFLDTPGHQAFTAMRARGAKVTDIAIIVVAADDNVMPQTKEAISHAAAAGVPIIFAINKIDKPGANPDRIKEELSAMNYLVEDWGGKYQSHDISAKFGQGVDELLEKVLLEAEVLDLKANHTKNAVGTVLESTLDKGRGYVATLLVSAGKIKGGDVVLAGHFAGRVKAMYNERNQRVEEAGPSTPVLILGLNGAPQAGDVFNVMSDEREAKDIASKREKLHRELGQRTQKHITLDEIGRRLAIGNFKELNVIIKGDVDGSIEALADSLIKLSNEEIQVNVIHKGVGQIAEHDIMLASASDAIIIGFQVRPAVGARKLAENEGIEIRLYSIIYDAINDLKDAMEGMLSPDIKEEILGSAEVLQVFKITGVGTIAGCLVREGRILRKASVRLIRDGIVVYTGQLESLKRYKDDAKEVKSGLECGLNIEKYNDLKVGDIVEAFQEIEVQKKLK